MSKIGEAVNIYGTPISVHICGECKSQFTVCPPADEGWGGCQSLECSSYDPARDADKLFDEAPHRIVRE